MLRLRRKNDGLTMDYESVSLAGKTSHENIPLLLNEQFDMVQSDNNATSTTVIVPPCGWANLTLENFEEEMGYRYRIDSEQSMRGITRELAFLEFLESKGVARRTKLVEGLTLENFQEKMGRRFRVTKEDKARNLTREQAFTQWLRGNGYEDV